MSLDNRIPNYTCVVCNKRCYQKPSVIKASKWGLCCSRSCGNINRSKHTKGKNNHQYGLKGNLNSTTIKNDIINKKGYILRMVNTEHPRKYLRSGRVYLHILLIEQKLGRLLKYISKSHPNNEVVHHIDRNPSNNALTNLQLMTHKEHSYLHGKEDKFNHPREKETGRYANKLYW